MVSDKLYAAASELLADAVAEASDRKRNMRIAYDLLMDARSALDSGKHHVTRDHIDRAIDYLIKE